MRRVWHNAPLAALVRAATRLRSVACHTPHYSLGTRGFLSASECATLGEALERLPSGGASLRELDLLRWGPSTSMPFDRLERLEVSIGGGAAAPALLATLSAAAESAMQLPRLTAL